MKLNKQIFINKSLLSLKIIFKEWNNSVYKLIVFKQIKNKIFEKLSINNYIKNCLKGMNCEIKFSNQ